MPDTIELRWGNRTLDLTATPYKNVELVTATDQPEVIEHRPDFGPPEVVRLLPTDRLVFLRVDVLGESTAALSHNAITDLRLLVDGAYQRAADSNENPVYLALDRNGGNGIMLHKVKYGNMTGDGAAIFRPETNTPVARGAIQLQLTLVLEEAGQAATAITLKNYLTGGDFRIFDGSNIGAGWATLGGSPTFAAATGSYLIGDRSQKITASGGSEGVKSNQIASSTSAAGYCWIRVQSGTVRVQIYDVTGTAELTAATVTSASTSYQTVLDEQGETWHKVTVSGSWSSTTIEMRVYSQGAAATFWMDAAYLHSGTTTVPDAWASYYTISNRGDRTAANPDRINNLDTWGIPGDMPAYFMVSSAAGGLPLATNDPARFVVSKLKDGRFLVSNIRHWAEDDEGTTGLLGTSNGSWSAPTGSFTDGRHLRYTEGTNVEGGYVEFGSSFFSLTNTTVNAFWSIPRRVYALCRSSVTAGSIKASIIQQHGLTATELVTGTAVSLSNANTWELLDLGVLNADGLLPDGDGNVLVSLMPRITVTGLANTNTFDVDAVIFAYAADDGLLIWQTKAKSNQIDSIAIRGSLQEIKSIGSASDIADTKETGLGACWTLRPGNIVNRTIWALRASDDEYDYTDSLAMTMTVTPRARLLLGKQKNL